MMMIREIYLFRFLETDERTNSLREDLNRTKLSMYMNFFNNFSFV